MTLPHSIRTQYHRGGHIQGIALDRERGWLYCSFTTELVKYDLAGNLLGSVGGLTGHLGCIALAPDGRVFGSLEYKNDAIGRGILARAGADAASGDAFYMAIFDGERITRTGMDARTDGVMTAAHLGEVTADYLYEVPQTGGGVLKHRFGCSGIDGTTFAPLPGDAGGRVYCCVAYGVYGDVTRADNDHQVILAYDPDELTAAALPLDPADVHRSGPAAAGRYFVYTGNTHYGVQNLEYEAETGRMYMAVYRGKKPVFPNYAMYTADWNAPPRRARLAGFGDGTEGDTAPLWRAGLYDAESGVFGWNFRYGSTGMIALGGGEFYFSREERRGDEFASEIVLYRFTGETPDGFSEA